MAAALQNFKEVPLHHMFHLGRDLAKGKLQEIAASYLSTGNYKLGEEYKARNQSRDVDKAEKLLERLGVVPTYAQLVERLRKGVDVRPSLSEYRSPTAVEETDDENDDAGAVADQVVVVDTVSEGLQTDLEGLVGSYSYSYR